jgi:hypothetical protein
MHTLNPTLRDADRAVGLQPIPLPLEHPPTIKSAREGEPDKSLLPQRHRTSRGFQRDTWSLLLALTVVCVIIRGLYDVVAHSVLPKEL